MTTRGHLAALAAAAAVAIVLVGCTSTDGGETAADAMPSVTVPTGARDWTPPTDPTAPSARPPASAPAAPAPELAGIDRDDPVAVADAVVRTWFTFDTTTDRGPNDAAARAAVLLTPALLQRVTGTAPISGPGGQWLEWDKAKATVWPTIASTSTAGARDTATTVHRNYRVEQTAVGADNSIVSTSTTYVAVLVVATDAGWAVEDVHTMR